jgi:hypothetical protein
LFRPEMIVGEMTQIIEVAGFNSKYPRCGELMRQAKKLSLNKIGHSCESQILIFIRNCN